MGRMLNNTVLIVRGKTYHFHGKIQHSPFQSLKRLPVLTIFPTLRTRPILPTIEYVLSQSCKSFVKRNCHVKDRTLRICTCTVCVYEFEDPYTSLQAQNQLRTPVKRIKYKQIYN